MPAMDIVEKPDSVLIHMDVPGVQKEDIKVQVEDGVLTVSGERRTETEEKSSAEDDKHGGQWMVKERTFGSFKRQVALPKGVNLEEIKAAYDQGVLNITVPKMAEAQAKEIAIQ
jgi:HSP20 family protein